MVQLGDSVQLSPEQEAWQYETYDRAVISFMRDNLKLEDGSSVPTVFATPDRYQSQMRKRFNLREDDMIPLPACSVSQIGDTVLRPEAFLSHQNKLRRIRVYPDGEEVQNGTGQTADGNATVSISMPKPLPYNFSYQSDVWTKNRFEAMKFYRQVAVQFNRGVYTYLSVDHGWPLGRKIVPIFLDGITDNTQLETADGPRILRYTFSFRVEGWLAQPVEEAKLVHKIIVYNEEPDVIESPDQ